ncbi:hypothetical protein LX59_00771 [Azomonas agilis]|uniref:Uncharacterized protein n=1 Tax=Azomonas agilis TaxID=116849 RepID=A0A562J0M0_9GAMM|nr:hypothetical protein LX59_00771 [Azomonas agilis]
MEFSEHGKEPFPLTTSQVWQHCARCISINLIAGLSLTLCACGGTTAPVTHQVAPARASEVFQSPFDRMSTLAMRDNLNSLYRLMHKLYQRNPRELHKSGYPNIDIAEQKIRHAIEHNQALPALQGLKEVQALSYVLSPHFNGDRVGGFIYAIATMLITAHGGRTEFYLTDKVEAQYIHNAARNMEKAAWLLSQRKDVQGQPLLLSNEISEDGRNLSFAVEFGKIVARLDLMVQVLEEQNRRIGVNYAHSLLFINFLPVQ